MYVGKRITTRERDINRYVLRDKQKYMYIFVTSSKTCFFFRMA